MVIGDFLIPNLITLRSKTFTQVGLSGGLIFVVHAMYQCLVNYTGAVPAEFYSIKKRPVGIMIMIKYMMYKVFECLVNCT